MSSLKLIDMFIGVVGSVSSAIQKVGGGGAPTPMEVLTSRTNQIVTLSYPPVVDELNKNPIALDIYMTGTVQVGQLLTAHLPGRVNGPFVAGAHEFEWYRVSARRDGTLTLVASTETYTPVTADATKFLAVRGRYVQVGGLNNKSPWMYSILSPAVAPASGGDITFTWAEKMINKPGQSCAANWNDAGVAPAWVNLQTGGSANWTTVEATKPNFNGVDKLIFTNAHKITGGAKTFPGIFDIMAIGRFTANNGAMFGWGSQTLFGLNSSGQYVITGMTPIAGDFSRHLFWIRLNGVNSKFRVDNGAVTTFDENFTSATSVAVGQTFSGANPGDFELEEMYWSPHNSLMTDQQIADKTAYHGF